MSDYENTESPVPEIRRKNRRRHPKAPAAVIPSSKTNRRYRTSTIASTLVIPPDSSRAK